MADAPTPEPSPYYSDDHVTIYHGDCLELLPTLDPVDLVLTDPPFSATTHANAKTNRGGGRGTKAIRFDDLSTDDVRSVLSTLGSLSRTWVVTSLDWRHIAAMEAEPPMGLRFLRFGVWVKPNPMPQISGDRPAQGWVRTADLYAVDDHTISHAVRDWCLEHGDDPRLRIVLAGYRAEHDDLMPDTWRRHYYSASAAYSTTESAARQDGNHANRANEVLWFSPHCVTPDRQGELWEAL